MFRVSDNKIHLPILNSQHCKSTESECDDDRIQFSETYDIYFKASKFKNFKHQSIDRLKQIGSTLHTHGMQLQIETSIE